MTEAQWLAATNPYWLINRIKDQTSARKVRLWAVARCRRIWELLVDERWREAVMIGERFADGDATEQDMDAMQMRLSDWWREEHQGIGDGDYGANNLVRMCGCCLTPDRIGSSDMKFSISGATNSFRLPNTDAELAYARDIFRNPFRSITFDPRWQSETVVSLATGIYADRAFDRMPILADALEEAGCDHADILAHCRGPGPHVRGCWVVDLLLGKS